MRNVSGNRTMLHWLQHQSALWPLAVGSTFGLGIGVVALFGLGGLLGIGVCLLALGAVCWLARDAEPVLGGVATLPTPQDEPPVPLLVEPLDMVELPGGTFWMGSPETDAEAAEREKPQHEVTVLAFAINRYPITRQLYRDICGTAPDQWARDRDDDLLPANYVSWFDAIFFCNALSERVGLQPCYRVDGLQVEWDINADGYRLPTEAEWEYACRAGTTSKWSFGDDPDALDRYAWFTGNSGNKVQPVGGKAPNPWGLYDMHGNVWEWCWDWFGDYRAEAVTNPTGPPDGQYRVLRGGSTWSGDPWVLCSAVRDGLLPALRHDFFGLRGGRRPRRRP